MKTKIYLFNNTQGISDWNVCIAMADTGEVLASHICSHIIYMRGDLYYNRPERKEAWAKKFPNGIEIIELEQGEVPPSKVIKKNEKLGDEATKNAELAKVEVQISES